MVMEPIVAPEYPKAVHSNHDATGLPPELPLVTSLTYYALFALCGRIARGFVKNVTHQGSLWQQMLLDCVTSWQLMAMSLENGQLRIHYGDIAYVCTLCVTGLYTYYTVLDGTANPCTCLVGWMQGCYEYKQASFRTVAQLVGGLASYPCARLFWRFGLTQEHYKRFTVTRCRSDLTVTTPLGFVIEFAATLINTLVCFNTFSGFDRTENLSKGLLMAYLTLLGVDMTGMYANPLNATNQTFGCEGPWHIEFLIVYWVAPLMATAVAVWTQSKLKPLLSRWTAYVKVKLIDDGIDINSNENGKKSEVNSNISSTSSKKRFYATAKSQ